MKCNCGSFLVVFLSRSDEDLLDVTHESFGPVCGSVAKSKNPAESSGTETITAFMFMRAFNYYLNVQQRKIKEAIGVTRAIKSTCAYGELLISHRVNGFGTVYLVKRRGRDDFANSQTTA